jgi:hypothetical protein
MLLLAAIPRVAAAGDAAGTETRTLGKSGFTYELFEAAVQHVDLPNCPPDYDPDTTFCRLTLANDMANVFVFSFQGDLPLLEVRSYALDSNFLPF